MGTTSQSSVAILFADITGSTSLYEKLGNERAHRLVMKCLEVLASKTEEAGGAVLRKIGDEVMAKFENADGAFRAAVAMQEAQAGTMLSVRIGFHYGPVIADGDTIYGDAVNLAARMAALATAEEIITTEETVKRLSPELRKSVRHLDTRTIKGKEELIPVYQVVWQTDDLTAMGAESSEARPAGEPTLVLRHQGRAYTIRQANPQLTVGRTASNDLVIGGGVVSKRHATIRLSHGSFVVTDMSANGTHIVEHDGQDVVLKREATRLVRSGAIGFGKNPFPEWEGTVYFECVSERPPPNKS